jgi:hypothetical protein
MNPHKWRVRFWEGLSVKIIRQKAKPRPTAILRLFRISAAARTIKHPFLYTSAQPVYGNTPWMCCCCPVSYTLHSLFTQSLVLNSCAHYVMVYVCATDESDLHHAFLGSWPCSFCSGLPTKAYGYGDSLQARWWVTNTFINWKITKTYLMAGMSTNASSSSSWMVEMEKLLEDTRPSVEWHTPGKLFDSLRMLDSYPARR